jgi:hypothetical protein
MESSDFQNGSEYASLFTCPHCGADFAASLGAIARMASCSHCGQDVILPPLEALSSTVIGPACGDSGSFAVVDDRIDKDQLDLQRIRRIATHHRSLVKNWRHAVIGMVFCAVAATTFMWLAYMEVATGRIRVSMRFIALIVLFIYWTAYFAIRLQHLRKHAIESGLTEPTAPPDFSALNDGSQRWRDLEDVQ